MTCAANADTSTVSGGTVNFTGQVVNAACSVSADSIDQTVILSQVRTSKLTASGVVANQKEDFSIKLEDCDTTVSQNAAVILMVSRTVRSRVRWRIPLARVRRLTLRCSYTARMDRF